MGAASGIGPCSPNPSPSPSPNPITLTLTLTRSAPANKFYAKERQLKFAHLNVDLNWAKGSASGLLTELAGDRPMSRASRMLLKSPLDAKAPDGKPQIKIGISGAEVKEAVSRRR